MDRAVSYAFNRLFALAAIALVLHNVFGGRRPVSDADVDEINHRLGFGGPARRWSRGSRCGLPRFAQSAPSTVQPNVSEPRIRTRWRVVVLAAISMVPAPRRIFGA